MVCYAPLSRDPELTSSLTRFSTLIMARTILDQLTESGFNAGFERIVEKEAGTFKYFLKIVPTEYVNLRGVLPCNYLDQASSTLKTWALAHQSSLVCPCMRRVDQCNRIEETSCACVSAVRSLCEHRTSYSFQGVC